MSEAQAEKAVQRLYENEGLRGELTDDEAGILLAWGESQIAELAARELDDDTFDARFGDLSRLIVRINAFTGKRTEMSPEAQHSALAEIVTLAQTLHLKIASSVVEAYAQKQRKLTNSEALQALIALIKPPIDDA